MTLSINELTSEQLDYLVDLKDRALRALDRANGLVEEWRGDQTPITRAEAAELVAEFTQLRGWTQSESRPLLAAVPEPLEAC